MCNKKNILFSNEFLDIELINHNYPFLKMKKNGAVIIAYDKYKNIYLLKKNRFSVGEYLEAPRGFVKNTESFEMGAIRELLEETGMNVQKVEKLGTVQPDTGVMNSNVKMYAMLVEERESFEHFDHTDSELSKVIKVPLDKMDKLISEGKIICSYTLSGICKFKAIFN